MFSYQVKRVDLPEDLFKRHFYGAQCDIKKEPKEVKPLTYNLVSPFFDFDFSYATAETMVQNIERYIRNTSDTKKETATFVEEIRNKIIFLHNYHLKVLKWESRYPFTERFPKLLIEYVVLECRVLCKSSRYFYANNVFVVQDRISRLLLNIYRSYLVTLNVPNAMLMRECCKAIIRLFIELKALYDIECEVLDKIVEKLLKNIGNFETIKALQGKHLPCTLDSFLARPDVVSFHKNVVGDFWTEKTVYNDTQLYLDEEEIILDDDTENDVEIVAVTSLVPTVQIDDNNVKVYWDTEVKSNVRIWNGHVRSATNEKPFVETIKLDSSDDNDDESTSGKRHCDNNVNNGYFENNGLISELKSDAVFEVRTSTDSNCLDDIKESPRRDTVEEFEQFLNSLTVDTDCHNDECEKRRVTPEDDKRFLSLRNVLDEIDKATGNSRKMINFKELTCDETVEIIENSVQINSNNVIVADNVKTVENQDFVKKENINKELASNCDKSEVADIIQETIPEPEVNYVENTQDLNINEETNFGEQPQEFCRDNHEDVRKNVEETNFEEQSQESCRDNHEEVRKNVEETNFEEQSQESCRGNHEDIRKNVEESFPDEIILVEQYSLDENVTTSVEIQSETLPADEVNIKSSSNNLVEETIPSEDVIQNTTEEVVDKDEFVTKSVITETKNSEIETEIIIEEKLNEERIECDNEKSINLENNDFEEPKLNEELVQEGTESCEVIHDVNEEETVLEEHIEDIPDVVNEEKAAEEDTHLLEENLNEKTVLDDKNVVTECCDTTETVIETEFCDTNENVGRKTSLETQNNTAECENNVETSQDIVVENEPCVTTDGVVLENDECPNIIQESQETVIAEESLKVQENLDKNNTREKENNSECNEILEQSQEIVPETDSCETKENTNKTTVSEDKNEMENPKSSSVVEANNTESEKHEENLVDGTEENLNPEPLPECLETHQNIELDLIPQHEKVLLEEAVPDVKHEVIVHSVEDKTEVVPQFSEIINNRNTEFSSNLNKDEPNTIYNTFTETVNEIYHFKEVSKSKRKSNRKTSRKSTIYNSYAPQQSLMIPEGLHSKNIAGPSTPLDILATVALTDHHGHHSILIPQPEVTKTRRRGKKQQKDVSIEKSERRLTRSSSRKHSLESNVKPDDFLNQSKAKSVNNVFAQCVPEPVVVSEKSNESTDCLLIDDVHDKEMSVFDEDTIEEPFQFKYENNIAMTSFKNAFKPFRTKAERKAYNKLSLYVSIEKLHFKGNAEKNDLQPNFDLEIVPVNNEFPTPKRLEDNLLTPKTVDEEQFPIQKEIELEPEKKVDSYDDIPLSVLKQNLSDDDDDEVPLAARLEKLTQNVKIEEEQIETVQTKNEPVPKPVVDEIVKSEVTSKPETPFTLPLKFRRKSIILMNTSDEQKTPTSNKAILSPPKLRARALSINEQNNVEPPLTPTFDNLFKCKNTISPTTEKLKRKLLQENENFLERDLFHAKVEENPLEIDSKEVESVKLDEAMTEKLKFKKGHSETTNNNAPCLPREEVTNEKVIEEPAKTNDGNLEKIDVKEKEKPRRRKKHEKKIVKEEKSVEENIEVLVKLPEENLQITCEENEKGKEDAEKIENVKKVEQKLEESKRKEKSKRDRKEKRTKSSKEKDLIKVKEEVTKSEEMKTKEGKDESKPAKTKQKRSNSKENFKCEDTVKITDKVVQENENFDEVNKSATNDVNETRDEIIKLETKPKGKKRLHSKENFKCDEAVKINDKIIEENENFDEINKSATNDVKETHNENVESETKSKQKKKLHSKENFKCEEAVKISDQIEENENFDEINKSATNDVNETHDGNVKSGTKSKRKKRLHSKENSNIKTKQPEQHEEKSKDNLTLSKENEEENPQFEEKQSAPVTIQLEKIDIETTNIGDNNKLIAEIKSKRRQNMEKNKPKEEPIPAIIETRIHNEEEKCENDDKEELEKLSTQSATAKVEQERTDDKNKAKEKSKRKRRASYKEKEVEEYKVIEPNNQEETKIEEKPHLEMKQDTIDKKDESVIKETVHVESKSRRKKRVGSKESEKSESNEVFVVPEHKTENLVINEMEQENHAEVNEIQQTAEDESQKTDKENETLHENVENDKKIEQTPVIIEKKEDDVEINKTEDESNDVVNKNDVTEEVKDKSRRKTRHKSKDHKEEKSDAKTEINSSIKTGVEEKSDNETEIKTGIEEEKIAEIVETKEISEDVPQIKEQPVVIVKPENVEIIENKQPEEELKNENQVETDLQAKPEDGTPTITESLPEETNHEETKKSVEVKSKRKNIDKTEEPKTSEELLIVKEKKHKETTRNKTKKRKKNMEVFTEEYLKLEKIKEKINKAKDMIDVQESNFKFDDTKPEEVPPATIEQNMESIVECIKINNASENAESELKDRKNEIEEIEECKTEEKEEEIVKEPQIDNEKETLHENVEKKRSDEEIEQTPVVIIDEDEMLNEKTETFLNEENVPEESVKGEEKQSEESSDVSLTETNEIIMNVTQEVEIPYSTSQEEIINDSVTTLETTNDENEVAKEIPETQMEFTKVENETVQEMPDIQEETKTHEISDIMQIETKNDENDETVPFQTSDVEVEAFHEEKTEDLAKTRNERTELLKRSLTKRIRYLFNPKIENIRYTNILNGVKQRRKRVKNYLIEINETPLEEQEKEKVITKENVEEISTNPEENTLNESKEETIEVIEENQGESCHIQEEPCKVQEEPCQVQEEPCQVQEEPCLVQEEQCQVHEELCRIQEEPCEVQEPCLVQEEPCQVQEEPCEVQEELCLVQEEPCQVQEEPCEVQEELCLVQEEPCQVQEEPCEVQEEIEVVEEHISCTEIPNVPANEAVEVEIPETQNEKPQETPLNTATEQNETKNSEAEKGSPKKKEKKSIEYIINQLKESNASTEINVEDLKRKLHSKMNVSSKKEPPIITLTTHEAGTFSSNCYENKKIRRDSITQREESVKELVDDIVTNLEQTIRSSEVVNENNLNLYEKINTFQPLQPPPPVTIDYQYNNLNYFNNDSGYIESNKTECTTPVSFTIDSIINDEPVKEEIISNENQPLTELLSTLEHPTLTNGSDFLHHDTQNYGSNTKVVEQNDVFISTQTVGNSNEKHLDLTTIDISFIRDDASTNFGPTVKVDKPKIVPKIEKLHKKPKEIIKAEPIAIVRRKSWRKPVTTPPKPENLFKEKNSTEICNKPKINILDNQIIVPAKNSPYRDHSVPPPIDDASIENSIENKSAKDMPLLIAEEIIKKPEKCVENVSLQQKRNILDMPILEPDTDDSRYKKNETKPKFRRKSFDMPKIDVTPEIETVKLRKKSLDTIEVPSIKKPTEENSEAEKATSTDQYLVELPKKNKETSKTVQYEDLNNWIDNIVPEPFNCLVVPCPETKDYIPEAHSEVEVNYCESEDQKYFNEVEVSSSSVVEDQITFSSEIPFKSDLMNEIIKSEDFIEEEPNAKQMSEVLPESGTSSNKEPGTILNFHDISPTKLNEALDLMSPKIPFTVSNFASETNNVISDVIVDPSPSFSGRTPRTEIKCSYHSATDHTYHSVLGPLLSETSENMFSSFNSDPLDQSSDNFNSNITDFSKVLREMADNQNNSDPYLVNFSLSDFEYLNDLSTAEAKSDRKKIDIANVPLMEEPETPSKMWQQFNQPNPKVVVVMNERCSTPTYSMSQDLFNTDSSNDQDKAECSDIVNEVIIEEEKPKKIVKTKSTVKGETKKDFSKCHIQVKKNLFEENVVNDTKSPELPQQQHKNKRRSSSKPPEDIAHKKPKIEDNGNTIVPNIFDAVKSRQRKSTNRYVSETDGFPKKYFDKMGSFLDAPKSKNGNEIDTSRFLDEFNKPSKDEKPKKTSPKQDSLTDNLMGSGLKLRFCLKGSPNVRVEPVEEFKQKKSPKSNENLKLKHKDKVEVPKKSDPDKRIDTDNSCRSKPANGGDYVKKIKPDATPSLTDNLLNHNLKARRDLPMKNDNSKRSSDQSCYNSRPSTSGVSKASHDSRNKEKYSGWYEGSNYKSKYSSDVMSESNKMWNYSQDPNRRTYGSKTSLPNDLIYRDYNRTPDLQKRPNNNNNNNNNGNNNIRNHSIDHILNRDINRDNVSKDKQYKNDEAKGADPEEERLKKMRKLDSEFDHLLTSGNQNPNFKMKVTKSNKLKLVKRYYDDNKKSMDYYKDPPQKYDFDKSRDGLRSARDNYVNTSSRYHDRSNYSISSSNEKSHGLTSDRLRGSTVSDFRTTKEALDKKNDRRYKESSSSDTSHNRLSPGRSKPSNLNDDKSNKECEKPRKKEWFEIFSEKFKYDDESAPKFW